MIWLLLGIVLCVWALLSIFGGEYQRQRIEAAAKAAASAPTEAVEGSESQ